MQIVCTLHLEILFSIMNLSEELRLLIELRELVLVFISWVRARLAAAQPLRVA